jgi:hypothetical protein
MINVTAYYCLVFIGLSSLTVASKRNGRRGYELINLRKGRECRITFSTRLRTIEALLMSW